MEQRRLGRSELTVSALCLGTMTFGEQNSERDAHAQLDLAVERGIDFIDTAEMYPPPPKAETTGRTEAYIGSWLKARGRRDRVKIASKVAGRGEMVWLRADKVAETRLNRAQIVQALDQSLRRLNTDYLDLYQVHWPERVTNYFGRLDYPYGPKGDAIAIEETLAVLDDLRRAGKVREIGVSNESPWGVMRYLRAHEAHGHARIVSNQNAYSLLNRVYEVGLSEIAAFEDVGLLAYSALGMGMLTGKYRHGARPPGSRLALFTRFQRYNTPETEPATELYLQLAERHGLSPTKMAIAFALSRPFVTSVILGATSLDQLNETIDAADLTLDPAVLEDIDVIHRMHPNPSP